MYAVGRKFRDRVFPQGWTGRAFSTKPEIQVHDLGTEAYRLGCLLTLRLGIPLLLTTTVVDIAVNSLGQDGFPNRPLVRGQARACILVSTLSHASRSPC